MVENNEQWEDTENSDNQEFEEYSDDEQNSEQEYDDDYDYEDDEDYEGAPKKKGNPLPLIIIFVILIGVIAFILVSKMGGGSSSNQIANNPMPENNVSFQQETTEQNNNPQNEQSTDDLANSFFNEAGGENADSNMMNVNFNEAGETNVTNPQNDNGQVATVTESTPNEVTKESDLFDTQTAPVTSGNQENNAIMVVYNKAARTNPFKPPIVEKAKDPQFELLNNTPFEIIEPPTASVEDENVTKLLKTQISGILYDNVSPSAIVNLNGLDHFVKVGDTISGYKIQSITKDKVQINYKNNSYVASVGELFTKGDLDKQQDVANLQNKFAGRRK